VPDVSEAQKHFMGMSQSPEGRAKLRAYGKEPAPAKAAPIGGLQALVAD